MHSVMRILIECLWKYVVMILLPFVWPVFLFCQFVDIGCFSVPRHNSRRNSFQSHESRKKRHQSKNYNFFSYWYLENYQHNIVDQRYGIFHSTYAVYSWWAIFFLKIHIIGNDIDKMRMMQSSQWSALDLLSVPYQVFKKPPKKPPDGVILALVVVSFICISCMLAVTNSFIMIFGLKLGVIYNPAPAEKPAASPNPLALYTIHVLKAGKLEDHIAF